MVEHRSPRYKDLLKRKEEEIESPRGERQGGDQERERVKLTALVPGLGQSESGKSACVNKNVLYVYFKRSCTVRSR